jgi:hypothetical protein
LTLRLIKSERGIGKVFDGREFIADIRYEILIYKDEREVPLLDGTLIERGAGSVLIQVIPPASVAGREGRKLTLHMSDGRKRDFYSDGQAFGEPY